MSKLSFPFIINPKLVVFLDTSSKKDALEKLIRLVDRECQYNDISEIRAALFYREKLMSTGIGLGIAIPHARIEGINEIQIAVGVNKKGIEDYESIDGKLVKIVFLIVLDKTMHREFIKILAQIVKKIKNEKLIHRLLGADTPDDFYHILLESEE